MRKTYIVITLLLLVGTAFAQTTITAVVGEQLRLKADQFEGTIQWQRSNDNTTWENIPGATTDPFNVTIATLPVYFRAAITQTDCPVHYSELITVTSVPVVQLSWSDLATWGTAGKPKAGDVITIAAHQNIVLDEDTPALGGLNILGKLSFARKDLHLTSEWIMVEGTFEVGTSDAPFTNKAIITINDTNMSENIMGGGTRGIVVMGGTLDLHGASPSVIWTRLSAHANANATALSLLQSVNWKIGDEIVIAPTDFYRAANGNSVTQRVALSAVNGNQVTIAQGLNAFRWGLLQYPTTTGMSLSSANIVAPPVPDTPTRATPLVLDERAEVGNVTRNIVIEAPDDPLWRNSGFGVHVMIMGPESTGHVDGVEFKRGGQRGVLGRYPFHWHMLSYNGTQTLADATGQYLKNSTINSSRNRGVVIHGTNGVTVQNNIVFDVEGHGIFTEDAVERRNLIDGNLVLFVRNPPAGQELKIHESGAAARGSSGFWVSNPDNTMTNNVAADCTNAGMWLAFTTRPWGLSSSVLAADGLLIDPSRTLFGVFDNNTAHSNRLEGILLDRVEVDQAGNVLANRYISTTNGREPVWPYPNLRRFALSRYKVWKNGTNGMWDRSTWVDNHGVVSADNCGRFFAGAGDDGIIENSLVVGTSLNHMMNGTGRPASADFQFGYSNASPTAFATYHSTFDIRNNIVINFDMVPNDRSGVFATDDYYVRPVEKGHTRNVGNLLINAHPGVKLNAISPEYKLASAVYDPNGTWGPAGNYFVYDLPFLTHGKTVTVVPPGAGSGGVSVPGPFYGVLDFALHGEQNQPDLMALHVRRLDENLNEVATWDVASAKVQNGGLGHMRNFATSPDGIYELTFPGETELPDNLQMTVENFLTTSDTQVIGVQYDGALNPQVRVTSIGSSETYTPVASLQAVRDSGGATWWQDKTNNLVWIKVRGGLWQFWTTNPNQGVPSADMLLYEQLRITVSVP